MLLLDRDYHIYGNHVPVILYYKQRLEFYSTYVLL